MIKMCTIQQVRQAHWEWTQEFLPLLSGQYTGVLDPNRLCQDLDPDPVPGSHVHSDPDPDQAPGYEQEGSE